jgi:hypothetical protein
MNDLLGWGYISSHALFEETDFFNRYAISRHQGSANTNEHLLLALTWSPKLPEIP